MTCAIHQPNFLPWLGYFYKMYASDIFVFHDAVAFSRTSYTRRCKIRKDKHAVETTWLSVPVHQHHEGVRISDVSISNEQNWVLKHLHKIQNTYSSAQHFDTYIDWFSQLLREAAAIPSLSEMNMFLIRAIAHKLALSPTCYKSSELPVSGKGSALNLAIAMHLGATTYLSGLGSKNYQEDSAFRDAGIDVVQHDLGAWLNSHPYDQGAESFIGGLSIVDALMHIGAEGIISMFQRFQTEQKA